MAETTVGTNVTVNTVLPGPTASEGATRFLDDFAAKTKKTRKELEEEFFKTARPTSLLHRFEQPEEIGSVVAFVASPLASAINGATVRADGGVIRAIV
jgi:NAD(P)-dependent dehydrogenase (short-subunit alcohol dehydrogenase family)